MGKIFAVLCTLVCATPVAAFFPLTHVFLAELWCAAQGIEEEALVVKGSIFPDICKIADIPKSATHGPGDYEAIWKTDDRFEQGQLLHHYADRVRKGLVRESNVYSLLEAEPAETRSKLLQLIEDEIVYEWGVSEGNVEPFEKILAAELASGIDRDILEQWNAFLAAYLAKRPSERLAEMAATGQDFWGISPEQLQAWSSLIPQLAATNAIQDYVLGVLHHFREKFDGRDVFP